MVPKDLACGFSYAEVYSITYMYLTVARLHNECEMFVIMLRRGLY